MNDKKSKLNPKAEELPQVVLEVGDISDITQALEHMDSEFSGKGVVYIDKKVCLRCTQLVGELGKKDFGCGIDTGNTNCPAARMMIMEGIDIEGVVDDYVDAIRNLDLEAAAAILTSVQERPEAIVTDFGKEVCDRMGLNILEVEDVEDTDDEDDDESDEDDDGADDEDDEDSDATDTDEEEDDEEDDTDEDE
jgi:hypothetical protein